MYLGNKIIAEYSLHVNPHMFAHMVIVGTFMLSLVGCVFETDDHYLMNRFSYLGNKIIAEYSLQ